MFSKTYSIKTRHEFRFLVNGALWLLYSILYFFDSNIIIAFLRLIFMIGSIITTLLTVTLKFEKDDEMSINNLDKAQALSLQLTLILIMLMGMSDTFTILLNKYFGVTIVLSNIPLQFWPWFIVGFAQFFTGIGFIFLEKHGEF